jgi:hypothetical protein
MLFVAGFAVREVGAYNYDNLNIFIASTVLLLVAPFVTLSTTHPRPPPPQK